MLSVFTGSMLALLKLVWYDLPTFDVSFTNTNFFPSKKKILALFESSAYPQHSPSRATNALLNLDQLIKNIHLTTIDLGDRDVCIFSPNLVPVVLVEGGANDYRERKCSCLPSDTLDPPNPYNNRPYHLPWDSSWSSDEIHEEEVRRLCWSALTLVSEYIARCEAFNEEPPAFYLADPTNVGLFLQFRIHSVDRMAEPFLISSDFCSLARLLTARHRPIVPRNLYPGKSRCGRSIAGACFFGISVTDSAHRARTKNGLNRRTRRSLRPRLSRIR